MRDIIVPYDEVKIGFDLTNPETPAGRTLGFAGDDAERYALRDQCI